MQGARRLRRGRNSLRPLTRWPGAEWACPHSSDADDRRRVCRAGARRAGLLGSPRAGCGGRPRPAPRKSRDAAEVGTVGAQGTLHRRHSSKRWPRRAFGIGTVFRSPPCGAAGKGKADLPPHQASSREAFCAAFHLRASGSFKDQEELASV